jgi:hypothetical protein
VHDNQSFQDDASREGAMPTGAIVVQPIWSRLSPGKLTEEEGTWWKNDAFKK